jgi:peptidoglycan/LPS O-acetylase OafA/YrhL
LFTYTGNFARLGEEDLPPVLVHLWSLSVEEQFYLIWPIVAFLLRDRALLLFSAALVVLGPALRFVVTFLPVSDGDLPVAIYSLPTSHLDAFAAGAMLTFAKSQTHRRAVGFVLLGFSVVASAGVANMLDMHSDGGVNWKTLGFPHLLAENFAFVWGYSILNLGAACAILAATRLSGTVPFLSAKPLVYVGKISYGAYVYHLPLHVVLASLIPPENAAFTALYAAAVLGVSALSYRFFELPLLKLKDLKFVGPAEPRSKESGEPGYRPY